MKKICVLVVFALLVFCIPNSPAMAAEDEFDYIIRDGGAMITDISGYDDVVIPDTLDGYPVIGISEGALERNTSIDSLFIPASVTTIQPLYLFSCYLAEFIVDENNPNYAAKDGILYSKDFTTLVCVPPYNPNTDGTLTILDGVTTLARYAVTFTDFLYYIELPDSLVCIEDEAFWDNARIKSITLPKNVASIGENVFYDSPSLETVLVAEENPHFTSIDGVLFDKAQTRLVVYPPAKAGTSYTVPSSVTSIASGAFSYCTALEHITLPPYLPKIGAYTFQRCSSLQELTLPNGITSIEDYAFFSCVRLSHIVLPDTVTSIGQDVFSKCYSLTSIQLPKALKQIGREAFSQCYSLTNIRLPEGITSIDEGIFWRCGNLKHCYIPDSVNWIYNDMFEGCYSLNSIFVPKGTRIIRNYVAEWPLIHCEAGSKAEKYAMDNEIAYILVCPPKNEAGNRLTLQNIAQAEEIHLGKQYMELNGSAARLTVASYDNRGALLGAQPIDAAPYDTGDAFVLPNNIEIPAGTAYMKIYVWQSPQSLRPACVPFEIL